jgi:RecA/RadA recombinase
MSSLLSKLHAAKTLPGVDILSDSKFFNDRIEVVTDAYPINIALGGALDTGIKAGLLQIVGPSRHFKTSIALVICAAYLKKYSDAVMLFFDNEFGAALQYFEAAGIDTSRVLHCPFQHIEDLKFEMVNMLEKLKRGDKVIFFVDSLGMAASKKEVEDAIDQKSVADMTRAKAISSLMRMITPMLNLKDIPCIVVNHYYDSQGLYTTKIVGGGQKAFLASNDIWIISREQEKDAQKELLGYTFNINIEKSRRVKEKAKIPLTVHFSGGIKKHSGLFDLAREFGYIISPKNGWYQFVNPDTGEVSEKNMRIKEFTPKWWEENLANNAIFRDRVRENYQVVNGKLLMDDDDEYDELEDGGEE